MVAVLFFLKVFVLGFFVIPLWDIPDEIGHYAYAWDLAQGEGIPLLGHAKIEAEIIANLTGDENAGSYPVFQFSAIAPPITALRTIDFEIRPLNLEVGPILMFLVFPGCVDCASIGGGNLN